MPKLKVQLDDGEVVEVGSIRVIYELSEDERDESFAEDTQLHHKYTDEGRVVDFVQDGEVSNTGWSSMDDLIRSATGPGTEN